MAINGKIVVGVILARGGSRRVPRKNLREFRGHSLLAWAAIEGKKSVYIDDLFVSTDDEEIKRAGKALGLLVADRPPELSSDTASSEDALRDFIAHWPRTEWVVLLQPTSPLRTAEDIDACIERAQMGDACISVGSDGKANGAVYVARAEWIAQHDFTHHFTMKYRMPDERGLDINEEKDFE